MMVNINAWLFYSVLTVFSDLLHHLFIAVVLDFINATNPCEILLIAVPNLSVCVTPSDSAFFALNPQHSLLSKVQSNIVKIAVVSLSQSLRMEASDGSMIIEFSRFPALEFFTYVYKQDVHVWLVSIIV